MGLTSKVLFLRVPLLPFSERLQARLTHSPLWRKKATTGRVSKISLATLRRFLPHFAGIAWTTNIPAWSIRTIAGASLLGKIVFACATLNVAEFVSIVLICFFTGILASFTMFTVSDFLSIAAVSRILVASFGATLKAVFCLVSSNFDCYIDASFDSEFCVAGCSAALSLAHAGYKLVSHGVDNSSFRSKLGPALVPKILIVIVNAL